MAIRKAIEDRTVVRPALLRQQLRDLPLETVGIERGRFAWCRLLERAKLDLRGMLRVVCKQ
jgi:hypothetical protein